MRAGSLLAPPAGPGAPGEERERQSVCMYSHAINYEYFQPLPVSGAAARVDCGHRE